MFPKVSGETAGPPDFGLFPLSSKSKYHQIKLVGAGLKRSKKKHLFPKEIITFPDSAREVMIKFPLNPKEESPQLITKHDKTTSVSASLCVETAWKIKGLGASFSTCLSCSALAPGP